MFKRKTNLEQIYSYTPVIGSRNMVLDASGNQDFKIAYEGWEKIHIAAYHGNYELLLNELNRGISVNLVSDAFSSRGGYCGKFQWRYKKDLKIIWKNMTPLYVACQKGHLRCVKLLMERGADPSIKAFNTNANEAFSSFLTAISWNRFKCAYAVLYTKPKNNILLFSNN